MLAQRATAQPHPFRLETRENQGDFKSISYLHCFALSLDNFHTLRHEIGTNAEK